MQPALDGHQLFATRAVGASGAGNAGLQEGRGKAALFRSLLVWGLPPPTGLGIGGAAPGSLSFAADVGAPVYFYEFQHRPDSFKDSKPAFVKADHTDEIRFVFGGAFLKGDVIMFGKEPTWFGGNVGRGELCWSCRNTAGVGGGEVGKDRPPHHLSKPFTHPNTASAGGLALIYLFSPWLINVTFPGTCPPRCF